MMPETECRADVVPNGFEVWSQSGRCREQALKSASDPKRTSHHNSSRRGAPDGGELNISLKFGEIDILIRLASHLIRNGDLGR